MERTVTATDWVNSKNIAVFYENDMKLLVSNSAHDVMHYAEHFLPLIDDVYAIFAWVVEKCHIDSVPLLIMAKYILWCHAANNRPMLLLSEDMFHARAQ